jgi:hypothetical protein
MISKTPNQFFNGRRESGSTLLVALITMVVLTAVAASVFLSSVPAYRSGYQASAWQEAKLAADSGVDFAMTALQNTVPNPMLYTWPEWHKDIVGGGAVPLNYDGVRVYVPPAGTLGKGDGTSKPRVVKIEVDVITRDTNFAQNAWFRIRSTGLAEVNSSQLSLDKRDLMLRRMTLQKGYISRTVEVMARPVYLWEYALKTSGSMVLGGGQDWKIDSYDSREPGEKSTPLGTYDLQYSREFGNIASDLERPENSPIGMLIDAEGAVVKGEVQTNGGDDPNTDGHENVEDAENVDPVRITDEYNENLVPEDPPVWNADANPKLPDVAGGAHNELTGTQARILTAKTGVTAGGSVHDPFKIILNAQGNQKLGGFIVDNATPTQHRFVEIYVNGDIDLGGSAIYVHKNVHVKLYLNGDLNFRNRDINYVVSQANVPSADAGKTPADYSNQPADLLIFGMRDPASTPAPKVDSSGNGHIVAAFYGPQYAGNLDGNTEIMGSFVLKTYNIAGGGGSGGDSVGAGLHYDEALGVVGPVKYYKAVSYFEDTRMDVNVE